jgi:hypothetical protein
MIFKRFKLYELDKSPLPHLVFYICGFEGLLLSHKISPTNLAGPGLDMFVFFAFAAFVIGMFIWGLIHKGISLSNRLLIILIHIVGIATLYWWMNQPS